MPFATPTRFLAGVLVLATATSLGPPAHAQQAPNPLIIRTQEKTGALEILDGATPVLVYHDQMEPEPPGAMDRIAPAARKYAVPRCDYIHPLYGLRGETLTDDWANDHPHHRGLYWAWPEVDWRGQRGDLHALQHVFARPSGKVQTATGNDFVEIRSEHQWRWEDGTAIVREEATVRAYRRTEPGRAIDLVFRFTALGDDVQVARRGQRHYGGLNLRLAKTQDLKLTPLTDPAGSQPRAAWAHYSGIPQTGKTVVGLTILQSTLNPEYPGDWVQFPNLPWLQPTFPTAGARYTITKDRPLELRFRLWIHDQAAAPDILRKLWNEYNASNTERKSS